ncbi:MAG TPA: isoprenylcysteine carboxylmethyltransferase family protein [Sphingobium sp.]
MRWLSLITFGCWWVFLIVWIAKGRDNKQSVHQQSSAERNRYRVPMITGIIVSTGFPRVFGPPIDIMGKLLWAPNPVMYVASAAVSVLGLALALWARSALGRNWSYQVTLKQDHELITDGPYAAIRHPIYTAVILLFIGIMLLIPSICAVIGTGLIVWSCWVKLRQEEALMLKQFPDSYPAYMARTKRLVPVLV